MFLDRVLKIQVLFFNEEIESPESQQIQIFHLVE